MEEQFKLYDYKTPKFSLNGVKTYGRVVDVIDGDTLAIVIPIFENKYFKLNYKPNLVLCVLKLFKISVELKFLL